MHERNSLETSSGLFAFGYCSSTSIAAGVVMVISGPL
jgi:hypothetical protein